MFEYVEIPFGVGHLLMAFEGNRFHDCLYLGDGKDDIGAIYLAKVERPVKGIGGVFVSLGAGKTGFWRIKNPPREGSLIALQIVQTALDGKPARLSERIDFRGRNLVLTPKRKGLNVSRQWASALNEKLRAEIEALLPEDCGAILRSEAEHADKAVLLEELDGLVQIFQKSQTIQKTGLILKAKTGIERAALEWGSGEMKGHFDDHQKDALTEALAMPISAGGGKIYIERTRALICVDIDTASNTKIGAGKEVNLRAIPEIVKWFRWMGWGGQLAIDPAPMPMQARKGFEEKLKRAAKVTDVDFLSRGFGPLGLCEGQLRYARRPIPENILQQIHSQN